MSGTNGLDQTGNVLFLRWSVITVLVISCLHIGCANTSNQVKPATSAAYYYNRGLNYVARGQYDLAISDYSKAIEINPGLDKAYDSRGAVYGLKGQYDRAIADFTKAIELNPSFAEAYYNRGYAYFFKQQDMRAISEFTKAIEINPKYMEAYNMRGGAYIRSGDNAKGCDDLKRACDLGNCDNYSRLCQSPAPTAKSPEQVQAKKGPPYDQPMYNDAWFVLDSKPNRLLPLDTNPQSYSQVAELGPHTDPNQLLVIQHSGSPPLRADIKGNRMVLYIWSDKARHHIRKNLSFDGYEFRPEKDSQLTFEVDIKRGYVFVDGRGNVTLPSKEVLWLDSSKAGIVIGAPVK